MKRILWLSGLVAMFLGFVSCDKNPIDVMIKGGDNIYVNPNTHWTNSNTPAYIGDISAYPAALQEVIRQRFPKQVSMETAGVIFVGAGEVSASAGELASAAVSGAFVVVPATRRGTRMYHRKWIIINTNRKHGYRFQTPVYL